MFTSPFHVEIEKLMPRCCAGERCQFLSLGLHSGPGGIKTCPDCGEKIHDISAFEDGEAGLSEMNVCPDCWDARKPPAAEDEEASHAMKTIGSISVERAAKPLKNKVADKSRNRSSKDTRMVLLRVGLNLRLKRESLQSVKGALGKVLDPNDALVYE